MPRRIHVYIHIHVDVNIPIHIDCARVALILWRSELSQEQRAWLYWRRFCYCCRRWRCRAEWYCGGCGASSGGGSNCGVGAATAIAAAIAGGAAALIVASRYMWWNHVMVLLVLRLGIGLWRHDAGSRGRSNQCPLTSGKARSSNNKLRQQLQGQSDYTRVEKEQ